MPEIKVEDLKLGDKVVITLSASIGFYIYKEDRPPDPKAQKEELPVGIYVFKLSENPGRGAGEYWLVAEYPPDSGKKLGISARFLFNLASKPGSNITIEKYIPPEAPLEPKV